MFSSFLMENFGAYVLTYIIDANNVIHRHPELREHARKDIEGAGERFIALVSGFSGKGRKKVVLVFDGTRGRRVSGTQPVQVIVPESGENADLTIKKLVDKSKNPRNIVVVSSDAEVTRYGKLNGCRIMSAEEFITMISRRENSPGDEKPSSVSGTEKENWLRLFGEKRGSDSEC